MKYRRKSRRPEEDHLLRVYANFTKSQHCLSAPVSERVEMLHFWKILHTCLTDDPMWKNQSNLLFCRGIFCKSFSLKSELLSCNKQSPILIAYRKNIVPITTSLSISLIKLRISKSQLGRY